MIYIAIGLAVMGVVSSMLVPPNRATAILFGMSGVLFIVWVFK
jgi:hypothetical protein